MQLLVMMTLRSRGEEAGGKDVDPPAVLVEYDPAWRGAFERVASYLKPAMRETWAVEHVGSTSIRGMVSKPIIDIDVVVPSEDEVQDAVGALETLGYVHEGDRGVPGREAFAMPRGTTTTSALPYHHLYVVVRGTKPYRDHVDLRDYLRADAGAAKRYGLAKRKLEPLLAADRAEYVARKGEVVERLLREARGENYVGEGLP